MRIVTRAECIENFYLIMFGLTTSTSAIRTFAVTSRMLEHREKASFAYGDIRSAALSKQGSVTDSDMLNKLFSVKLMRPLGGVRIVDALRK